jgi:hypothetical protein
MEKHCYQSVSQNDSGLEWPRKDSTSRVLQNIASAGSHVGMLQGSCGRLRQEIERCRRFRRCSHPQGPTAFKKLLQAISNSFPSCILSSGSNATLCGPLQMSGTRQSNLQTGFALPLILSSRITHLILVRIWQREVERSAAAHGGVRPDASAMPGDYPLHDG